MNVYNLGMLTAGLPNPSLRQASTQLMDPTSQRSNYMAGWQGQWDAATPKEVTTYEAPSAGTPISDATRAFFVANGADPSSIPAVWGATGGGYSTNMDNSARQALEAERDKWLGQQASGWNAYNQAQAMNQTAYNNAGGGSYLGGQINASYATPQTGLDPNSSLNGMLNTQPWSMPSFGGPNGGQSQAGFGGPQAPSSQPQGWGGPFTARNPWAAS